MAEGRLSRAREFCQAHWPRLAVTGVLLVVLFGNGGFRSLVRNWLELRKLNGEIVELNKQEQTESDRLKMIQSGDSSLERLARRELGFIKKGEIEYRFPPPAPEPSHP